MEKQKSVLDTILNIGASFDWLTPAVAFLQDFLNGSPADFGIPAYAGWKSRDIKRLFTKRGIRVWGLMYNPNGEILMFTVQKYQAKRAYSILQSEGIPIEYAPGEAGQ